MKSKFNKNWNRSVQPRKQRKFLANAPKHIQRRLMSSSLEKKLKEKYKRKNISVVKGDEVKVMRGKYKGKQGKVSVCDVKNTRIQIEGITRQKKAGDKIGVWFHPSKVKIVLLNEKDSKRIKKGELTKKDENKEIKDKEKENAHKKK
ncbi:MAG: 50S ribosomal protein L24 [Candidatus Pacearchaeota archaeon]